MSKKWVAGRGHQVSPVRSVQVPVPWCGIRWHGGRPLVRGCSIEMSAGTDLHDPVICHGNFGLPPLGPYHNILMTAKLRVFTTIPE
jgi:hypothetical protein